MKQNKGFSLVELIVSIAILAIVSIAIGSFLVTGTNSFIRSNREVELQEEAQLSANQIMDIIIDVEKGVRYEPSQSYVMDGTSFATNALYLYNKDKVNIIRWIGDNATGEYEQENCVYLMEAAMVESGGVYSIDYTGAEDYLLAQYVESFSVDMTELSERRLKLQMKYSLETKDYEVNDIVRLRNDIARSDDLADIYDGQPVELTWIENVVITPMSWTLDAGGSKQFTYQMTGESEAVSRGVTWTVEEAGNPATCIDSDGNLVLASTEDGGGDGIVKVVCTSNADPSKKATATVTVNAAPPATATPSPTPAPTPTPTPEPTATAAPTAAPTATPEPTPTLIPEGEDDTPSLIPPTAEIVVTDQYVYQREVYYSRWWSDMVEYYHADLALVVDASTSRGVVAENVTWSFNEEFFTECTVNDNGKWNVSVERHGSSTNVIATVDIEWSNGQITQVQKSLTADYNIDSMICDDDGERYYSAIVPYICKRSEDSEKFRLSDRARASWSLSRSHTGAYFSDSDSREQGTKLHNKTSAKLMTTLEIPMGAEYSGTVTAQKNWSTKMMGYVVPKAKLLLNEYGVTLREGNTSSEMKASVLGVDKDADILYIVEILDGASDKAEIRNKSNDYDSSFKIRIKNDVSDTNFRVKVSAYYNGTYLDSKIITVLVN